MNLEQRVQQLEQEVQLLKNQIQATLLDIQDAMLSNRYPTLRGESNEAAEPTPAPVHQVTPQPPYPPQAQPQSAPYNAAHATPQGYNVQQAPVNGYGDAVLDDGEDYGGQPAPRVNKVSWREMDHTEPARPQSTQSMPVHKRATQELPARPSTSQEMAMRARATQEIPVQRHHSEAPTHARRPQRPAPPVEPDYDDAFDISEEPKGLSVERIAELREWFFRKVKEMGILEARDLLDDYTAEGHLSIEESRELREFLRELVEAARAQRRQGIKAERPKNRRKAVEVSAHDYSDQEIDDAIEETFFEESYQRDNKGRFKVTKSVDEELEDEEARTLVLRLIAGMHNAGDGLGRKGRKNG